MNKPTIPNEVADAIEFFREDWGASPRYTNAQIIEVALKGETESYEGALALIDIDTLMAALINGYEREATDKQRRHAIILEVYGEYREGAYEHGYNEGIRFTLDTLGIQIEGVNAK